MSSSEMMVVEEDDARHKKEQAELRAKRKAAQRHKSESAMEKDRKRREHAARVLNQQRRSKEEPTSAATATGTATTSSVFAGLFAKRAEGFLVELDFRNAPPRPPVGPCFVGLGLEGELTDKWTRYKPFNAVETNYSWKLHTEPDLGVPLAPSAMDLEGCYVDPAKKNDAGKADVDEELFGNDDEEKTEKSAATRKGPPPLHASDKDLIDWKGGSGDTAAEELQMRQDRARAAARLQTMGGTTPNAATSGRDAGSIKLARDQNKDFKSRVLNEKAQFWMKKTTYLTNDQTRAVHKFTSLADTKRKVAQETETMLEMNKQKHTDEQTIQAGFAMANNPALLGNKRKHPTKRGVTAVCDVPILPNVSSWGHTFTHVVIDNPPKEVPSKGSERPAATMEQLERAFVADVEKKRQNSRMMCNLLAPSDIRASDASEPTLFHVVQQYDLDVVPLKEEGTPHVNFLLLLEERPDGGGSASYHPIPSRVQLSTGRPAKRNMAGSIIAKRALDEQDMKELESRVAEIDADLAEKYGLYETTNANDSYPPSSKQNNDNEDDEEPPEKRRAMAVEEEEDRTF